ncbi:hypothetical protein FA169_32135, partial [Pseudomonas aeruginosa]|nr:hypothetical protein [Pseudomonas aeruginosa]
RGLSFELGGKRTSLLAHQTPLSRRGFSPKSVSGISRPLQKLSMIYPEAFALASPKKLQLSRAFALIMPILQGRVFKMKSLA